MHSLNEELERHRGREGKSECTLCGAECENMVHVLWECSVCSISRASSMLKLKELLGDRYAFLKCCIVREDVLCIREVSFGSRISNLP